MLTKLSHRYALRISDAEDRRSYRLHMCTVCHALGDNYGPLARLLTTREIILLNVLLNAQLANPPKRTLRHCPISPLRTVPTTSNVESEFSAAVAVELAYANFEDDILDSRQADVVVQASRIMLLAPHRRARDTLAAYGTLQFSNLTREQQQVEATSEQNALRPTAHMAARLFKTTAILTDCLENAEPLSIIGEGFGTFIYLHDAYCDFAKDMVQGQFNPLARFAQHLHHRTTLSFEGLCWLHTQFSRSASTIAEEVSHLRLYRYHALIRHLLLEPIHEVIGELEQYLQQQRCISFHRWNFWDAVKASLFLIPPALIGLAFSTHQISEPDPSENKKPKHRSADNCRGGRCSRHCEGDVCHDASYCCYLDGNECQSCDSCSDNHSGGCVEGGICEPFDCDADFGFCEGCGDMDCSGCDLDCGGVDCGGIDCG